jgi:AraC family transcriptional regulator
MEPLEITTVTTARLAAIRHTGPYNQIGPSFRELGKIAGAAGLFKHPGSVMVGVYHDDPTQVAPEKLRSAAGITVPDQADIPNGLVEEKVEAGEYAVTTHIGSYEGLPNAWRRAGEELARSGRARRKGPSYEMYVNDPSQVPESELKTQIYLPVE